MFEKDNINITHAYSPMMRGFFGKYSNLNSKSPVFQINLITNSCGILEDTARTPKPHAFVLRKYSVYIIASRGHPHHSLINFG